MPSRDVWEEKATWDQGSRQREEGKEAGWGGGKKENTIGFAESKQGQIREGGGKSPFIQIGEGAGLLLRFLVYRMLKTFSQLSGILPGNILRLSRHCPELHT